MSLDVFYKTRGEVYEEYKSNLDLAAKFFPKEMRGHELAVPSTMAVSMGLMMLISLAIGTILVVAGGPYSSVALKLVCKAIGISAGIMTGLGLIGLAIWYCKRRNLLSEKLSIARINHLAGEKLLDPTAL